MRESTFSVILDFNARNDLRPYFDIYWAGALIFEVTYRRHYPYCSLNEAYRLLNTEELRLCRSKHNASSRRY